MDNQDQYIKGFNRGYALRQYRPDLAKSIDKLDNTQDFIQGFKAGSKQYETELDKDIQKGIEHHRAMSQPSPRISPEKPRDKDKSQEEI